MKLLKTIILILLSITCVIIIIFFDVKHLPAGGSLAGIMLGLLIQLLYCAIQDLTDDSNWKESQRRLLRAGLLKDDTLVRISFAYLYRIKVGREYLLIRNARGTQKYQPVGGVYKLKDDERLVLNNLFHVVDDDRIAIDESSHDDYRLQMPCKYLKKFVKRFDSKAAKRERIDDVSREFFEELSDDLNWDHLEYRYCGRYFTDLKYSEHFKCYELLIADIVELIPDDIQLKDLENLKSAKIEKYKFATASEINSFGIVYGTDQLEECIADHSMKILQENEQYLTKEPHCGEIFKVGN